MFKDWADVSVPVPIGVFFLNQSAEYSHLLHFVLHSGEVSK